MGRETDAQLTTFIENVEFLIAKLRRYTTDVSSQYSGAVRFVVTASAVFSTAKAVTTSASPPLFEKIPTDVAVDEMQWTPSGIANSLAWIVRHCADLLWLSYGRLAGERIPVDLGYHTGQASYLKKLLAAERRRARARRRRAQKAQSHTPDPLANGSRTAR